MKKFTARVLSIFLCLSLCACSIPDKESTASKDTVIPVTETTIPSEPVVSISESVIVDESGIKITAKSLSSGSLFGPEVKLLIENNTDKNLTVQARNTSVNGYMVDTSMSEEVVAGKKSNGSLTLMAASLEKCGISTIADISFSFHIFTTDGWDDYLDTDIISLKTSAEPTFEYKFDDSGDTIYDQNNVKIVVKGLTSDSLLGPGISVYLENNTDHNITIQTRDVSVNGFMINPVFSADVVKGKRAISSITFMSKQLEENNITKIESVETSFHIFNIDNMSSYIDTEAIAITFK